MLTVLAGGDEAAMMLMFTVGGVIAIVAIITGAIQKVKIAKNREESRREIAAYIAEGSITAEDGRMLLEAGAKPGGAGCCKGGGPAVIIGGVVGRRPERVA